MADVSKTPANLRVVSDVQGRRVLFGESVSPGDTIYLKTSDRKYYKAINTSLENSTCKGIAIGYGGADTYGYIVSEPGSVVNVGATLTQGTIYVVSSTAGGMAPEADIGSGEYVTILGVGDSSGQLQLNIVATGLTHA